MKLTAIPTALIGLCASFLVNVAHTAPVTNLTLSVRGSPPGSVATRQAPIPAYTGPVDDDGLPTYAGTFEYAVANWPDPERTKDSIFWTGFTSGVDKTLATNFITTQLQGKGIWIEQVFQVKPGEGQSQYVGNAIRGKPDSIRWKATARSSQAFAEYTSGTAWLLIPKGVSETDPYPGIPKEQGGTGRFANWVFSEYNTLTRNALVSRIVRVNPDNFADQQTLWTRGDPAFGSPAATDADTPPIWASCPPTDASAGGDAANDGV